MLRIQGLLIRPRIYGHLLAHSTLFLFFYRQAIPSTAFPWAFHCGIPFWIRDGDITLWRFSFSLKHWEWMEMDLFKKDVRVVYFESNRYLESAVRRKAVCCAWGTFLEWEVPRARPLVQIQNGPSVICVVSRPSFQLKVGKTVWPEEKKRNSFVYFFLLTGGYSSVGRALPLQWCRTNDSFIGVLAFLRGFSQMKKWASYPTPYLPSK